VKVLSPGAVNSFLKEENKEKVKKENKEGQIEGTEERKGKDTPHTGSRKERQQK
jgi:hypothetical protein